MAVRQFPIRLGVEGDGEVKAKLQAVINAATGVEQKVGAIGNAARAADISAYGASLDSLRTKYVPLAAAQEHYRNTLAELRTALANNIISTNEHAAALARAKTAFAGQITAINAGTASVGAFGRGAGLASFQVLQLSQQFQDLGVQIAGGQNPLLALVQQGSQAAFVMGGFGASLAAVKAGVVALGAAVMANPLLIAGATVAAGIAAAGAAVLAFGDSTQRAASAQETLSDTLATANRLMEEAEEIAKRRAQTREEEIRGLIATAEAELLRAESAIVERRQQLERLQAVTPARGPAGAPVVAVEIERMTAAADAAEGQIEDLRQRLAALGSGSVDTAKKVRSFGDVLADLQAKGAADDARSYAEAVKLLERAIESGMTDQERYARQVAEIDRALRIAAEGGWQLSAENAERLNRALREADPAFRAAQAAQEEFNRDQERLAEERARILAQPFENALEGIQDSFTDFFEDAFDGGIDSFRDLAAGIKGIFVRLAAELAALMVIRPALGGILGAAGAGSIASGMGLMPTSGTAGGGLPGGVGLGDLFGLGKEFLGSGSGIGQWLFGAPAISGDSILGGIPATSGWLGSGGQFLGSTFLADAFLPVIGSALPGIIGGNWGQAGLGAGGALLGTAIGGPIGGVVGGLLGNLVGGLFGGKKKTPQAVTSFGIGGDLTEWTRSGGNIGATNELAKGIADTVESVVEALGGTLSSNAKGGYVLTSSGKNQGTIFLGGVGQYGSGTDLDKIFGAGFQESIKSDPNAIAEAVAVAVIKENAKTGAIAGLTATQLQVLRKTDSSGLQGLNADLAFAQWYDQVTGAAPEVTAAAEAIKALKQQFKDAREEATRLGLSVAKLNTAEQEQLAQLTADFNQANADYLLGRRDPLALALREFEEYAELQRRNARDLNADLLLLEERLAEERRAVVEQFSGGVASDLRRFWEEITFGPSAGGSPAATLSGVRAAFEAARSQAASGDASARGRLADLGAQLLSSSRAVNASGPGYFSDLAMVREAIAPYALGESGGVVAAINANGAEQVRALLQLQNVVSALQRVTEEQAGEIARLTSQLSRYLAAA